MSTFDIGPVSPMNHGGGYHYNKPRRRAPGRKMPAPSPSYEIEREAPIGAKKWLKTLFHEGAIRLSVERIAGLLGRSGQEEKEGVEEKTTPGPVSCGVTCRIFREAVALEEKDVVLHEVEQVALERKSYLVPLVILAAVGAFFLTVVVLDAVFGTRSLAKLLSLMLP